MLIVITNAVLVLFCGARLLAIGAWLKAGLAMHFRYQPYLPDPGHRRAEEREAKWNIRNGALSMARTGPMKRTRPRPIRMPGYKKSRGTEAKLSYLGHVMVENRHGFIVDAMLTWPMEQRKPMRRS